MHLKFQEGSQISRMYGSLSAEEEYYCNFRAEPRVCFYSDE